MMNENRIMQQVSTIFSLFMVLFYLGVGYYLIFSESLAYLDKALRIILGSTFILYGAYRAYQAYVKIVEVFFRNDKDQD